jgi:hypothetical protein
MVRNSRTVHWIAAGTFAAALFASASPARAWDSWGHRGRLAFRPHARFSVVARPLYPRVHYVPYSSFYRPYFAVRAFEPYPYFYNGVQRAYWPRPFAVHRRFRRY